MAILLTVFYSLLSQAQQDALYTQYQFQKLAINPAYAGSRGGFSGALIYRDQWRNIEGAPKTASLTMHGAVADGRIGLGLQFMSDRLGVFDETGAWGSFVYRIPAGQGHFNIGLSGGVAYWRTSLEGTFVVDTDDPVFTADRALWLPNVGAGIYYHTDRVYFGLAAPRLIDNELQATSQAVSGAQSARRVRHYNAMGGVVIDLGSAVKMRPAMLLRYVENAPFLTEANLSFLFIDRLWLGAGYRLGASYDFNMEVNLTENLHLGYSYDWVQGEIGGQTGGSHEFMFGIDLAGKAPPLNNPRSFPPNYF